MYVLGQFFWAEIVLDVNWMLTIGAGYLTEVVFCRDVPSIDGREEWTLLRDTRGHKGWAR